MKILLSVFLIFFGVSLNASAQIKTAKEIENLSGAVRSVSSVQIDTYGESAEGRRRQLDKVSYDKRGNEIKRVIYDDYGFLVGTKSYTYNAQGKLLKDETVDEKGTVIDRNEYDYNAQGLKIQTVTYEGNESLKQVYVYDNKSRLSEEVYSHRSKILGRTVYKYDEKGDLMETAFYLANGKKAVAPVGPCFSVHKLSYAFDAKQRPTKVVAYEPSGEVKRTTLYTFNDKGDIAEETRDGAYGKLKFAHAYERDAQGNWTKRITTTRETEKLSLDSLPSSNERRITVIREIEYSTGF